MISNNKRELNFYTDGSYSYKTEMGGWASICLEDDIMIDCQQGYEPYSSNNRMELSAFLSAMENIDTVETTNTYISIYTDSAYIANCFNQGWYRNWISNNWKTSDKQSIKNQDLWRRIISLYIKNNKKFHLQVCKVNGHSGIKWNEKCDELAKEKRNELEEIIKKIDKKEE